MENMGVGCLMVAGFPFFFLAWMVAVGRSKPKHYWLWGIVSIPAYYVAFCMVLSVLGETVSFYETRPSVIFRCSFGFSPTRDIAILHSSREEVTGKWDKVYLEFTADQPTIDRILQNGLARISVKEIIDPLGAPSWWKPNITEPATLIYATGTQDPAYRGEFRESFNHDLLIYNPVTKKAYFRYRR